MHEISLPYFCTVCVLDISTPSMIVTTVIVMFYMTNCVISETVAGEDQVILGRNKLEPVMLNLIGLPKRGTYVVKEEIEKAPVHDHPCNLTETVVKISFPEMKSEVFINLLGYKGSNMIYLRRCKGQCSDGGSPVSCRPTKIREKKVKMTVRSFLTGGTPKEQLKELILDDHVECGCECIPELANECAGMFNPGNCECECPAWEFGEAKMLCEMRRDQYWDPRTCKCKGKMVAPRGVDLVGPECGDRLADIQQLDMVSMRHGKGVDIAVWVLLGASFTMVMVLAMSTWHYRKKIRAVRNKERENQDTFNDTIQGKDDTPSFAGRILEYAGSIHSQQSFSDFQDQTLRMKKRSQSYNSCENLLQGLTSTQHVEIGGEVFFHPLSKPVGQIHS